VATEGKADYINCGAGDDLVDLINDDRDPLDTYISCESFV
jgi:hypothetical protein